MGHDEITGAADTGASTNVQERILAAVGGSGPGEHIVDSASVLASALGLPWHVMFVETPRTARDRSIARRAADVLAYATRLGATVSSETAHSVADGLIDRLGIEPARHLVIGTPSALRGRHTLAPALLRDLATRRPDLTIHLAPAQPAFTLAPPEKLAGVRPPLWHHGIAVGAVLLTLGLCELLSLVVGGRPLSLLFLFPVIAVAARLGLGPAITAVVSAVLLFDLFLLQPVMHLEPLAPVNIVLWIALTSVAVYTSLITGALRNRAALSDRNAQESARIVAFARTLGRVATWDETAAAICDEFAEVLNVQAVLFREEGGQLVRAAARPADVAWSPVAQAALDWAWANGTEAGTGTGTVTATDWRVQPLSTSLGTLAVLAISRDDSRNPIRADKAVLFATLVSQASLALERLVLEDRWRVSHGVPPLAATEPVGRSAP